MYKHPYDCSTSFSPHTHIHTHTRTHCANLVGALFLTFVDTEYARPRSCKAWRQTSNCDANSFLEPFNDRRCDEYIRVDWSGYCECVVGTMEDNTTFWTVFSNCDREDEFTCEEGCQFLTASPTFAPTPYITPAPPTLSPTSANENPYYLPSFRISDLSMPVGVNQTNSLVRYETVPICFRGSRRDLRWESDAPYDAISGTTTENAGALVLPVLTVNVSLVRIDDIQPDELFDFMAARTELSGPGESAEEWTLFTWVAFYYYELGIERKATNAYWANVVADTTQAQDSGRLSYVLPPEIPPGMYLINISSVEDASLTSQHERAILRELNKTADGQSQYFFDNQDESITSVAWVATMPFIVMEEIGKLDFSATDSKNGSSDLMLGMNRSPPTFAYRGGDTTLNWVLVGGVRKPEVSDSISHLRAQLVFEGNLQRGEEVPSIIIHDIHAPKEEGDALPQNMTISNKTYHLAVCAPRSEEHLVRCVQQYLDDSIPGLRAK